MVTQWIDGSTTTFLACCSCGWRGMTTTTKATADAQRAAHEARAHPDTYRGRDASAAQRRRDTR